MPEIPAARACCCFLFIADVASATVPTTTIAPTMAAAVPTSAPAVINVPTAVATDMAAAIAVGIILSCIPRMLGQTLEYAAFGFL